MKKISNSTQSPAVKSKPVAARVRKPAASASLTTAKSGRQRAAAPDALPVEPVDTSYLRTLVGYNARRASLAIIESFMVRMAPYDLKVVDFSVLSLVAHNPGITSRQLCAALNVLPPNLVGLIATLERRGLIERLPHPSDGRAMGVHLTPQGVEADGAGRANGL